MGENRTIGFACFCLLALAGRAGADFIPNDPRFSDQWALTKLNAPAAWEYSLGSASVTIAVLDTGIIFDTPDLEGRYLAPLNGQTGSPDGTALFPHGTWVASTIDMAINNGVGGAGTGNFSVLPIRISDSLGNSNDSRIVQGINLAAKNGCRVITISYGASNYSTINNAVAAALTANAAAGRPDFLVFMSAGNSNWNHPMGIDALDNAQSRLAVDHLIFVSGTDENDHRWMTDAANGSDTGPFVDLAAPAHNILVANGIDPSLPYGFANGTSFSSPYAASAAAFAFSINPGLTATQVENILFDTAFNPDNPNPGTPYWDQTFGWGRVDFAAVAAAAASTVPEPTTLAILAVGGLMLFRRPRPR